MKPIHTYLIASLVAFLFSNTQAVNAQDADTLTLEGTYQGRNLYVQFPFAPDDIGFCLHKIIINGEILSLSESRSANEIPLDLYVDSIGQPLKVEIIHPSGCSPKVLNPYITYHILSFNIEEIYLDSANVLRWIATKEKASTFWEVEQYRWNKWLKIGEVKSVGGEGPNSYSFDVTDFIHSGENKFRVKKIGFDRKPKYSAVVIENSTVQKEVFRHDWEKEKIIFGTKTKWEIYDAYGNCVKIGNTEEIDISNLKRGAYYLNFGNVTEEFVVR